MAALPARRGDLWSVLWHLVTGERLLAALLFALALLLVTLLVIPQAPDEPASLWQARSQARFGSATALLATLGLFALGRSPLLRLLLMVLTFVLITRTAERTLRLRQTGWRAVPTLAAHVGVLLLLLGLLVGAKGGWRAERLSFVPGEVLTVPGHGEVTAVEAGNNLRSDRPGVRLYRQGSGPLLTASASDAAGDPLGLQRSPDVPPTPQLRLRVTDEAADTYFAIPQAGLFVRVEPDLRAGIAADMSLRVQALRVPSGELAGETTTTGDADLVAGETHVHLARGQYLLLAAAYDPGYGLKIAGLVLAALALLVQAAWPAGAPSGRLQTVLRWAAGVLSLPTAVAALWSLLRSGLFWDGSGLQVALTMLWLIVAAAWLFWYREVWQE